ncbi:hypothetical protein [Breoghania sp.]|nr:hypothetical protein [Breoghania sp.]
MATTATALNPVFEEKDALCEDLDRVLRDHYERVLSEDYIREKSQQLLREGYMKVTEILPPETMQALSAEVKDIIEKTSRRIDIQIAATGNSPRKMSTVNYENFMSEGTLVPALYKSAAMR